ncbi:MAG: Multidrug resistance protein MdtK [Pseudomonadota bacterium]
MSVAESPAAPTPASAPPGSSPEPPRGALLSPAVRQELRATLELAWPVVVTQLGTMAMSLVDIAMVAPLGADALAGVGIGSSIHWMFATLLFGVLLALDPLISQAWGAGEHERVPILAWQGTWIAIFGGAVVGLLHLNGRWIFTLLDQPDAVADQAAAYFGGMAGGVMPFLLFVVGRSLLGGMGITRPVMVVTLLANGVNALADWVLIRGAFGAPKLGALGAGLATTTTRWAMVVALLLYLLRFRQRLDLRPRRPDAARIARIFRIGMPIGLQNAAEFGVFAAAGTFAGWLGAEALAAHQVALNLAAFAFMVPVGVSVAAAIRVGQAIGAGAPDDAARAGKVAMALGAAFMAATGLVFLSFPGLLAERFGGEPEVIARATDLLRIAAAFQVADGIQVVASGALRGAGDTRTAMVANLIAHWCFGLPFGYALAFWAGLGAKGLWWGLTGSLIVAAALLAGLFLRGGWRRLGRVHA